MNQKESIKKFMKHWGKKRNDAFNFRLNYNETFQEIDAFIRGEQWNNSISRKSWLETPVNNQLHIVAQSKIATISETELSTKLLPLSSGDVEVVESLEMMMDSYWKHSGVGAFINDVKQDSRTQPIGYIKIKFDGSALTGTKNNIQKGDFAFSVPKPMNIFWDPKAYSEDEASFIYETKTVTMYDLKNTAKYNQDVVKDIEEYQTSVLSRNKEESGEILDRNYDMMGDGMFTLYEIYYRWKPSPGSDFKYGEIHTVSMGSNDEESIESVPLYAKADLKIKRHPIIPLREFKSAHEFMGKSSVQLVLDKQKSINSVDAIVETIANQMQNQQKLVSADSGIDPKMLAKYGNAPGLIILTKTDINNSMKNVDPPEIPATLLQHKKESKDDMYDVANVTNAGRGQNVGSQTTATGTTSLIQQSASLETLPKSNYKTFLEKIYKTMMELIVNNLGKVERRIDNKDPDVDGEYKFQQFDMNDFKDVEADLSIDVRMTAAEIAQQQNQVMQILQLQAQTGEQILSTPTIIDLLNLPDKERILATYYNNKQKEESNTEMQVATQAALLMVQELQQGQGSDDIDISQMAQIAASEAIQQIKQQGSGQSSPGSTSTPTSGGAQGANAPQPAAQAAAQGQQVQ